MERYIELTPQARRVPVALVLLCEVNPALLALCLTSGVVHTATAVWDGHAATDGRREVSPEEQRIHSFLESIPFMAISALLCLHWDRVADRSAWSGALPA